MTDDRYDDGLVHSHGWATEPPAHQPAAPSGRMIEPGRPDDALPFDDGLVHAHDWASAERSQMAHDQQR